MNYNRVRKSAGISAIAGSILFIAIVFALHLVQPDYDPKHQLMSELALGHYGWTMLFAFLSLGTSVLAILIGLITTDASRYFKIILGASAACFVGSSFFPLGSSSEMHITLIAGAFVLICLAMVILPSSAARFSSLQYRFISWAMVGAIALSVALGFDLIPIGIAQRMAALCLLVWLFLIDLKLARH